MVQKLRVVARPAAGRRRRSSPTRRSPTGKPNGFLSDPLRDLARHRPRPHRHAALRLRGRHRLRALRRLGARRADVFRQARRRPTTTSPAPPSATSSPAASPQLPGERADPLRLGQPPLDAVSRGAPQALPRDARRRRRPAASASSRCPPSGSGSSTTRPRSTAPGTWSRAGGGGPRAPARRRAPPRRSTPTVAGRPVRDVARDALALARAGLARRARLRRGRRATRARYLDPLDAIVASGRTPAEDAARALSTGEWGGSVEPAFRDCVF